MASQPLRQQRFKKICLICMRDKRLSEGGRSQTVARMVFVVGDVQILLSRNIWSLILLLHSRVKCQGF